MSKGPNPKIFMGLTALTLVAGIGISYMQYNAWQEVGAAVQALKRDAKDETKVKQELETAKKDLVDTQAKLTHLEQGVTELAFIPTLLAELEKTGKDSGLVVLGVRPIAGPPKPAEKTGEGEKPRKKAYTELTIEVRCRGDYRSVMNFTSALRMFPKIVAAKTVSIQPKVATGGNAGLAAPKLDSTFELTSYVFPTKKTKDKIEEQDAPKEEKTIDINANKRMAIQ